MIYFVMTKNEKNISTIFSGNSEKKFRISRLKKCTLVHINSQKNKVSSGFSRNTEANASSYFVGGRSCHMTIWTYGNHSATKNFALKNNL